MNCRDLSRRQWLCLAASGPLLPAQAAPRCHNYFGDLHNHNNVGYAQGSLARTFEIAREHLDFFAFTPHAHWNDIGRYEGRIEEKWLNGFHVTRARWPDVMALNRKYDVPGQFVAIPGYEWHSTSDGDVHILFPDLDAELYTPNDLRQLQAFARKRGCLLIPHHPANRRGHRGADLSKRDPAVSPVLEIYSEWGNAEHDRAPYPYIRHTEGGRWTKNTLQYLLAQGHRIGVIASTDDHFGYPGAYREGLAAVKATALTREALFEAMRARRTYAVTGDRIDLDFTLNGRQMGQELPYARDREIRVEVSGWDQVDRVEVLKNNRVVHRQFPMDRETSAASFSQPVLVRFEYGWGPWPALGAPRLCDWEFNIRVDGGRILKLQPCFQTGPFAEGKRDRILNRSESEVRVRSFTSLKDQLEDNSTKAVVLVVQGSPDTKVTVACEQPERVSLTQSFRELAKSNEMLFTGEFPKENAMLHRLVFSEHYQASFTFRDQDAGSAANWYYVRVVQSNGQLAWSSPIWVEKA